MKISPRLLLPSRAAVVFAAALSATCGGDGSSSDNPNGPSTPAGPPNLVLILADDLDVAPMAHLPQIRSLIAARGMTFTNAFVTDSLCCPSRATLLTGQYAHNHGVLTNEPPRGGWERFHDSGIEKDTLAVWLRRGGYVNALVGKYLNRYPADGPPTFIPQGWEEWQAVFSDRGSDSYYNYSVSANGAVENYGTGDSNYITDVLTRKSLEFLRKTEGNDTQPFFLHITPNAPHRPADVARRHEALMPGLQAPRTPNWNEADISDKPRWLQVFEPFTATNEAQIDELYRKRVLSMLAVDELVQSVVQELERLGELSNTYVIFTSDNGFLTGPHRFGRGKDAPYEESIRVPLVVRGPGISAGSTSDAFVLNNDFAPTLMELAGQPIPASVDGRSFAPLLKGSRPADWRTDFLIEHWSPQGPSSEDEGNGAITDYFGVRTDRYAYIEYGNGETELYDLRSDPYQLNSLHRTATSTTLTPLKDRVKVLQNCRGASCR